MQVENWVASQVLGHLADVTLAPILVIFFKASLKKIFCVKLEKKHLPYYSYEKDLAIKNCNADEMVSRLVIEPEKIYNNVDNQKARNLSRVRSKTFKGLNLKYEKYYTTI